MPVLGCGHLGLDPGVDILQVGGCLVCARLLRVLYWLVEVEVHLGVSPEGGKEGGYLGSLRDGIIGGKLA